MDLRETLKMDDGKIKRWMHVPGDAGNIIDTINEIFLI